MTERLFLVDDRNDKFTRKSTTGIGMDGYLKPLRRKFGVVTLMIACVFMALWVRSLSVDDDVMIRGSASGHESLRSVDGQLFWGSFHPDAKKKTAMRIIWPKWKASLYSTPHTTIFSDPTTGSSEQKWSVIGSWKLTRIFPMLGPVSISVWAVSYWSIVFPMTVFSAWLLLFSRPKSVNPVQPVGG